MLLLKVMTVTQILNETRKIVGYSYSQNSSYAEYVKYLGKAVRKVLVSFSVLSGILLTKDFLWQLFFLIINFESDWDVGALGLSRRKDVVKLWFFKSVKGFGGFRMAWMFLIFNLV